MPPPQGATGQMMPPPPMDGGQQSGFHGTQDGQFQQGQFGGQPPQGGQPAQGGQFQGKPNFDQRPDQTGQQGGQFQQGQFQDKNSSGFSRPMMPPQSGGTQGQIPDKRMVRPANFQGQFQERQGQQQMMGGQNAGGSNQDDEANDATRQKQEQEQAQKQGARMAKMLQQQVTAINKRVAKLQAAGFALTSDCKDTITAFTDAIATAKAAQSMDDLQDVQDTMQSMDDLSQCRMAIERLISAPKMFKTANAYLKNLKRRKIDVTAVESTLNGLTAQLNSFKTGSATNDDVDSFFESVDELKQSMEQLIQPTKPSSSSNQAGNVLNSIKSFFGF